MLETVKDELPPQPPGKAQNILEVSAMAYEIIIRSRLEPLPESEPHQHESNLDERPSVAKRAANDNDIEWPLPPFPNGWLNG